MPRPRNPGPPAASAALRPSALTAVVTTRRRLGGGQRQSVFVARVEGGGRFVRQLRGQAAQRNPVEVEQAADAPQLRLQFNHVSLRRKGGGGKVVAKTRGGCEETIKLTRMRINNRHLSHLGHGEVRLELLNASLCHRPRGEARHHVVRRPVRPAG